MPRLLVVSDRTDDVGDAQRQAIEAAAGRAGYLERTCPDSWDEAVRVVSSKDGGPFHAAVIDIELWDRLEGGVDLIRELHSHQPACLIIALSEKRGEDALLRAMRAGASDYFNATVNAFWRDDLEKQLRNYRSLAGAQR